MIAPVSGSVGNRRSHVSGKHPIHKYPLQVHDLILRHQARRPMLTSKPRMPKLPSIGEIDRDIVTCEVALVTLSSGSQVFDPERESLSRKLSELLEQRLHCDRDRSTILRFAMRENANPSGLAQPEKGLT